MNRDWVDKDFYQVLGVGKEAAADAIKRAYRKLAQKYHPDANAGDPAAEERFKQVSEAYAVLSDGEQRKEYDELRRLVESGAYRGFDNGPGNPFGSGQRVRMRTSLAEAWETFFPVSVAAGDAAAVLSEAPTCQPS
jgi:DnaJ-class molecular chaperone